MLTDIFALKNDPEKWAKIEQVEEIRVLHPRLKEGIRKIDECRALVGTAAEAPCLVIYGEAGAGKTEIFREYRRINNVTVHGQTTTHRPVLCLQVPSPATIPAMIERLLQELGDRFYDSGKNVREKYERLKKLLRDCGVELILLDEFQHLLNSKNQKVLKDVSDWFKSFVLETNVSVVLFGHSECTKILDSNGQFERRFSDYKVEPFGYEHPNEREEFKRFLTELDKMLPFDRLVGLGDDDLSDRFFYASEGLVDKVMKLVRRGARIAIQHDKLTIELEDFFLAYNGYLRYLSKGERVNPFSVPDFKLPKPKIKGDNLWVPTA